ncbi:hypothetical protein MAR_002245, partial [Mya arenaria]
MSFLVYRETIESQTSLIRDHFDSFANLWKHGRSVDLSSIRMEVVGIKWEVVMVETLPKSVHVPCNSISKTFQHQDRQKTVMNVVQAILAKACFALCVIVGSMVYQEDQEYKLFFSLLLSYTIWLTIGVISFKIERFNGVVYDCLRLTYASSVFVSTYLSLQSEKSNYLTHDFLIDNVKPYFQYQTTLKWAASECFSCIVFIWRLMTLFNVSWKSFAALISYFALHACVLMIVVECILTIVASSLYLSMIENVMFTFDVNNSRDYPEGFFIPKNISKSPYYSPVRETKEYHQDFSGKFVLKTNFETVNSPANPDSSYPHYQMSVERYIGEDITFDCDYVIVKDDLLGRKTFWTLNEEILTNNTRYLISTRTVFEENGKRTINSKLKIQMLQYTDFGVFKCFGKVYHYTKNGKVFSHRLHTNKYLISIHTLMLIQPKIRLLKRSVGNIIASQGHLWYHSNQDINDFHLDYTVNGKPIGLTCPGENSEICSLGANILRMIVRIGAGNFDWPGTMFPFLNVAKLAGYDDLNRAIIYYCLCSSGFGVHRISFVRSVASPKTKRPILNEFENPNVYLILPHTGLSLFRVFDDSHLYKEIEDLVEANAEIELIEQKVDHLLAFISANEYKVLSITN